MPANPREAAGFLLGFWLALACIGPLGTPRADAAEPRATHMPELEARMHTAVNAARYRHHRIDLRRDAQLDAIALAHARDMALRGYLAHETPEGLSPVDRLVRGGADGFTLAAENIGLTDRGNPHREILQGWLASKTHRDNLLAPAFNTTGIGVARAADGRIYYAQVFVSYPR